MTQPLRKGQTLVRTWREVTRQAAALAPEQQVRLELLPGGEESAERQPNQTMLDAMRDAEEIQRGLRPVTPPLGLDAVSLTREARTGAMWGYDDSPQ